ncbi:hypothetical protein BKA65DRAFT_582752 [Rhexocercosporidium sp. MPI-PUGE-AT-0058]|nr:hypothetical protein BKA65DRAFT_582752 [Rhexocercosporidium sp. MPI-PUGE-AT-0058]
MAGFHYHFAQGMGVTLAEPTLYVLKNFGSDILKNLQIGFLTTVLQENNLLYEHAAVALNGNVLFNNKIIIVGRSGQSARIITSTPAGLTLVTCQKFLVAIAPNLENRGGGGGLSTIETKLFPQFTNTDNYTGLLRDTGT